MVAWCSRARSNGFVSTFRFSIRPSGSTLRSVGGEARPGGSTWQSLSRQAGSIETDYLNGHIVLLGRLYDVPTPVKALLQTLAAAMAIDKSVPGTVTEEQFLALLP